MSPWSKLEEEIFSARWAMKSIIIQLDANSKLGKDIIPQAKKKKTSNRAILAEILDRNALIVANAISTKCKGVFWDTQNMV